MIFCKQHSKIYDETELTGCARCKDGIKILDMYYGHFYGNPL